MVWPEKLLDASLEWQVPDGYRLRNFQSGDEQAYIQLLRSAGFKDWDENNLKKVLTDAVNDGIFFIEHTDTSEIVATTVAGDKPSKYFESGGELGWVACHPDHTGKRFGFITCAAVTARFLELGYKQIYLSTDDFRLPAIKTYLNLGYVPMYHQEDMPERWAEVFKLLKLNNADYPGLIIN